MLAFEEATAAERVGNGCYRIELSSEYAIRGVRPNGGYMLSSMSRAVTDEVHHLGGNNLHVVAAQSQFVSSPPIGPADVQVRVNRIGSRIAQAQAEIVNDGQPSVTATFTLGALTDDVEPFWGGIDPPDIAALEDCVPPPAFFADRAISYAFDPTTAVVETADGFDIGGDGEIRAWLSNRSGQFDSTSLLFVSDALPPATFGVVKTGWVPTLQLSVYVRAHPSRGPVTVRFKAQMISDGLADEVCEAWDCTGRLVMQSVQLAALRLPT